MSPFISFAIVAALLAVSMLLGAWAAGIVTKEVGQ